MHKSAVCSQDLQPDNYVWLIVGCLTCLIFPASWFYLLRTTSNGKFYDLGGVPILSAWSFFSKRYDFMFQSLRSSRGLPFSFRVLQHRVVSIPGPDGRKLFYNNASLSMSEGYKILLGASPRLEDINMEGPETSDLIKRLNRFILRKDRIVGLLPRLLDDINHCMSDWGREGVINPFTEVYDIVFQMTLRFASCEDLCGNREVVKIMGKLYWELEKTSTAAALLLPWFPSPSKKKRTRTTRELYNFILKFVQNRRAIGAPTTDPIDALIQAGDKDGDIVELVMGTVFAGVTNTGMNSCWALLYLGAHDEWRQRAISEIQTMVSTHSDKTDSLHNQLASIPFSAWEDELPALHLIIRETIRLSNSTTFLRRNLKTDIDVGGVHIAKGDFMAYLAGDVHMNEKIYPNPEKFDPGRYEEGRNEDKNADFGYVGWGAGRHPCTGMRMANLEMKMILTTVLLGYDYTLVDEHGKQTDKLPVPDRNDSFQPRPMGKSVYMKFKRVKE